MTLIASSTTVPGLLKQDLLVDGRFHLTTDEPERLGGTDEAASPYELLVAALAACTGTTVAAYVRVKGWDVGAIRVDVDYETDVEPHPFRVRINLEKQIDDAQRARIDRVAAGCPVRRALETGFEIRECAIAAGVGDCA